MANSEPATVILPFNLGAASKYEEHIFPLAYHHVEGTVEKGRLLLSATLDEMINMAEMGIDLDTDTRFRVDFKVELEKSVNPKVSLLNPLMYWQPRSRGGQAENSPKVSQSIDDNPSLSGKANVSCCV